MEEDNLIYFSFKLNFDSFYEDSDRMTFSVTLNSE